MIPSPLLVVTDRHGSDRPLTETVSAVLQGGARWIWFRDKDLLPEARRGLARELLALVRGCGGWLSIGGDAALAAEIGADGLHLGGTDLPVPPCDRADGRRLLGVSAHDLAEVRSAAASGADYVTLSPIFATPSKPGYGPALGLDPLTVAARALPVVALGGIGADRARACVAAGAAGVAVMGGLMRAADPAREAQRYLDALRSPL